MTMIGRAVSNIVILKKRLIHAVFEGYMTIDDDDAAGAGTYAFFRYAEALI